MNKFFITERGDIAYQIAEAKKSLRRLFKHGDALLIVTKRLDSILVQELCMEYRHCTIVHNNITGFGGTYMEEGVAPPEVTINAFNDLVSMGFPEKQLVLRIDPVIPTIKGTDNAIKIINMCPEYVTRLRFSFIDNYNHIKALGLPWNSFHAPQECQRYALDAIKAAARGKSVEACGEPQLAENTGCISMKDYDILGLPRPENVDRRGQRKSCMCLDTKTELLTKPLSCPNGCVYCYYSLGKKL